MKSAEAKESTKQPISALDILEAKLGSCTCRL